MRVNKGSGQTSAVTHVSGVIFPTDTIFGATHQHTSTRLDKHHSATIFFFIIRSTVVERNKPWGMRAKVVKYERRERCRVGGRGGERMIMRGDEAHQRRHGGDSDVCCGSYDSCGCGDAHKSR